MAIHTHEKGVFGWMGFGEYLYGITGLKVLDRDLFNQSSAKLAQDS